MTLTRDPGGSTEERVHALRAHGFDDAEILSATLVTGYFNFINRLASGLGVDLEASMLGVAPPAPFRWP